MALIKYSVTLVAKQDAPYNVLPDTDLSIRKVSDGSLVQIYSDAAGLIPIAQPGAKTDSRGAFEFYTDSIPVVKAEWSDGVNSYSEIFNGNSLQSISGLTEPSDLDKTHRTDATLAKLTTGDYSEGSKLVFEELGGAKFDVVIGGTPNGYDVRDAGGGNTARLIDSDAKYLSSYGFGTGAFAAATSRATNQSTIRAPEGENSGTFVLQFEALSGEGSATVFKGSSASAPTFTIKRKTGTEDWDFYKVENLKIQGFDGTAPACAQFDPADPFAGRTIFDNVTFRDAVVGVDKPTGNIGDGYYNCNFQSLDYGWSGLSSAAPLMHSGAVVFQQTNFDVIEKACIIVRDSVEGPGSLAVRDSLFQGCNGFGAFINYNNFIPVNPPVFDNVWMEQIALSPTTDIFGVTYDTRQIRIQDTAHAVIKGSYLTSIELVNSTLHAKDCRIDSAAAPVDFAIDDSSELIVDDMYGNGEVGGVPFVRSIARQTNTSGQINLSVRGPWKTNQTNIGNISNATNVLANSFSGSGPWGFTGSASVDATQANDGVLNDTCGELVVPAGATLISTILGTPVVGSWVVWGIHAKQVGVNAPTVADIGHLWIAGNVYLKEGEWVSSYGMQQVGSDAAECRLRFINGGTSAATIRLADFFVLQFTTYKEAVAFVNSGYSAKNEI